VRWRVVGWLLTLRSLCCGAFPDDLERLWDSTGVMLGFSLAVYIPAVGLAMVLLVARRWSKVVVAQEVVAAVAGMSVAGVAVCWWFGVFDSDETLATGIPVTAHVLHFPTLAVAVCVAVLVSFTPLFRRHRLRHRV
jgi:zinc transporter ZupT